MHKKIYFDNLIFRNFTPTDNIAELNSLLIEAYKPLAEAGMKYAASHEDVEATRRQIGNGECHIASLDGKIIACAILKIPNQGDNSGWNALAPKWYGIKGVTTFGRFAVSPELQGHGIGNKMMEVIENRARELGFTQLALDTSEHATHLIKMYERRGYNFIEFHQWNITNYRSVVMSKNL